MTPSEEAGFFYFAFGAVVLYLAIFAPGLFRVWRERWFFTYPASRGSVAIVGCCCMAVGLVQLGVVPAAWHGLLAVAGVVSLVVAAIVDLPDDDPPPRPRSRPKKR